MNKPFRQLDAGLASSRQFSDSIREAEGSRPVGVKAIYPMTKDGSEPVKVPPFAFLLHNLVETNSLLRIHHFVRGFLEERRAYHFREDISLLEDILRYTDVDRIWFVCYERLGDHGKAQEILTRRTKKAIHHDQST